MRFERLSGMAATAMLLASLGQSALADDMTTVRFGVDPYTTGSQIWVAEDMGFFEDQGIDADITTFATGVEAIDSMIVGRADLAVGLDFPTVTRATNGRLTVLAGIFRANPGWHKLVVSNEIKTPADLAGKKIGIATGTLEHLVTVKYLEANGLSQDDVELVGFTSLVELVASLKSGRIDASFVWADGTDKAIEDGEHYVLVDDSAAGLSSSAYITGTTAFVEENPDAVVGVLKAMDAASTYITDNPEEAAAIIASHTRAPRDTVRNLLEYNAFSLALGDYEKAGFDAVSDFVSRSQSTEVTFATGVDASFLTEAVPSAVTLAE